ncbi:MAG: CDP-alcohol phosphatidyltransferase family protein [Deltaproteobacteria bacterium]|nr:CDP-alcohol phosphatidyltransferase family protein [Deltaproteobacteria bacterium]
MCHPWLAAGVSGFLAIVIVREVVPVLRASATSDAWPQSGLLGIELRRWFRNRTRPLADVALAGGLTANGVTLLQLVPSLGCALAYARGWLFTAGWLLIASGTLDVLDGEMARRDGRNGSHGAFIDSMVDRYGEAIVFAGLVALYRKEWMLWLVLSAWVGGFLVSYVRARAESLGVECREGLLQRPERYVILGGASMVDSLVRHFTCDPAGGHSLLTAGIGLLAVLANVTAAQRIHGTWQRLA